MWSLTAIHNNSYKGAMIPKNIPDDINAELLFEYFPQGTCKAVFNGLHQRNAYNDLVDIEEVNKGVLQLTLGRTSLYNTLPEVMFHPIDRFDNLPEVEKKERFAKEYEAQEREKEQAHRLFEPIDLMLLQLRLDVRKRIEEYVETDKVLIDILSDEIPQSQRQNRFVRHTLPFLPSCKRIRGNKTLLTLMLRKVFSEEGMTIEKRNEEFEFTDREPRYVDSVGDNMESLYAGNVFQAQVATYVIHYWPEDQEGGRFLELVDEIEAYQQFIQDYFVAIDEILRFDISNDNDLLRLNNEEIYNYMNYNTNL